MTSSGISRVWRPYRTACALGFALCAPLYHLSADELKIAVAANFTDAISTLAPEFEKQTGHKIVPVFGATGKFYLQIKNGAPFEVFLAADIKHPRLLESEGLSVAGSRFTYATGKIVLWSPKDNFIDVAGKVLEGDIFKFVAVANPDIAPYGRATLEYLIAVKLWDKLEARRVMGQDLGQAYAFVLSGAAELGFVGLSQLQGPAKKKIPGSYFIIPQRYYKPLEQQAIQVKKSAAASEFMEFLKSPAAKKIIRLYGYEVR
jgi:molybdate transport system substrate-binding protein